VANVINVIDAALAFGIGRRRSPALHVVTRIDDLGAGNRLVIGPGDAHDDRNVVGPIVECEISRQAFLVGTEPHGLLLVLVLMCDDEFKRLAERDVIEKEVALGIGHQFAQPVCRAAPPLVKNYAGLCDWPPQCVMDSPANLTTGLERKTKLSGLPRLRGGDRDELDGVTGGAHLEHPRHRPEVREQGAPIRIGLKSLISRGLEETNHGLGDWPSIRFRTQTDSEPAGLRGRRIAFRFCAIATRDREGDDKDHC
jgi:hypothetical protein